MPQETGIWTWEEAQGEHAFDEPLATAIVSRFKEVQTVADLGCGTGRYCKFFQDSGLQVKGYDGTPNKWGIFEDISPIDLAKPTTIPKADLVVCLEVGEHVPKQYETILLDNITSPVSKYLILSWAIPGQGGLGHVNERSNHYIREKISAYGLRLLPEETTFLRQSSKLHWFKNTIFVFAR